jgi:hypothetical protein
MAAWSWRRWTGRVADLSSAVIVMASGFPGGGGGGGGMSRPGARERAVRDVCRFYLFQLLLFHGIGLHLSTRL